jgi:hypothetical protein
VITTRAINRATLARQMLLARESLRASEALERLVGMQAQAPNARAVRIAMMRSTIHLVTARDCLDLRPIFQPIIDRGAFGAYGLVHSDMDRRCSRPRGARCGSGPFFAAIHGRVARCRI